MAHQCPNCDAHLESSPRFCPECGSKLDSSDVTAPASPPKSDSSRTPSSTDGRFVTGRLLGDRYRIVQRLGQGGMGEVYRADDLELGQSVALKFLPERLAANDRALDRLRGEVRLARSVSQANVCRVYDIGQADGHFFISMEYVDGEDLADALRRMGRPSREKAEELARQICLGLAAAHEMGVLHRDLKPANIMIDGRGRARITDFGLARLAEEREDTQELAGTPAYMAPEQLSKGRVSAQSDIYSLGLVLHELFTGRRVFETDAVEELRAHHTSGSSTSSFADLDPAVERALKRCLETDPGERPRSVYDVLAALPGGDPLAAALAAGETPSPELVAGSHGAGVLRPRSVVLLVLWVVGTIMALAFGGGRGVRFPERAASELAVVAREIATRELGHSELPLYDASGLMLNPLHENEGARPYVAWRRWSPEPLESVDFHSPGQIHLNAPPHTLPGSVAILVDDTGTLVEASVIIRPIPHDPTAVARLAPLLERAGVDGAAVVAERADPSTLDPPFPVHCDHATVWRDRMSGEAVARAGVYAGRIVAFQRIGHAPGLGPARVVPEPPFLYALTLGMVAFAVMILAAIRNLMLGRGDVRRALRASLVMLTVYLLIETSSFDLDRGLLRQVLGLLGYASGGHAFLHAVQIGMIYLAFEPIARRGWPQVLIGWVRLIDGRLRDPRVGAEILIGLAVACSGLWVIGLVFSIFGDGSHGEELLHGERLWSLTGPAMTINLTLHSFSGTLFFTMLAMAIIGFGYLVTRSVWAGLVLAAVVPFALRAGDSALEAGASFGLATFVGIVQGASVIIAFRFGGLVAFLAFYWLFLLLFTSPALTTDLTQWHAPHTVFTVLIILLVLAHGAWSALSGSRSESTH